MLIAIGARRARTLVSRTGVRFLLTVTRRRKSARSRGNRAAPTYFLPPTIVSDRQSRSDYYARSIVPQSRRKPSTTERRGKTAIRSAQRNRIKTIDFEQILPWESLYTRTHTHTRKHTYTHTHTRTHARTRV